MQQEDVELEWLRQTEVIYYRLERSHSNALPQLKHNPWSLRCQQQHLQKMKENAKHRNQYSILPPREPVRVLSLGVQSYVTAEQRLCVLEDIKLCGLLHSTRRIYITGKPDVAAHDALRFGPEDGHAAAWRRRNRGEESREDPQVSAEHSVHHRSLPVGHAGRARSPQPHLCL